ncbi:uncharacterized protein LOC120000766 [Tripterygium wilfordii]|uniref:uncharacterized protein LOC120000766 n=1 Tax=Tripterygium wilfordii TaxID=458696 RepID=UPI0018F856D8|nr:uncharacterized protein LOC120000766 [Tripterygium wilfordii]
MGELYARGDKFMQSEGVMKISQFSFSSAPTKKGSSALGKTEKDLPPPSNKQRKVEGKSDKRKDDQSSRKTDQGPIPRYSSYTPLNNSLHNILLEVSHRDILKLPKKMRAPPEKHTSDKYCLFHMNHGHDTEECRHLKDEIEGLIRRGYLKQFTSDKEEKRRSTDSDDKDNDRRRQRRRDRYPNPHDDALVVEAVITNFTVKKVLVDNGRAADILFYHAFREMKISEDKLKSFLVPLYGFAGESIIPKGVISLPVTLGTYPRTVMHMINLLVVDVQSPYNAIIGEVKGDQKLARMIHYTDLKDKKKTSISVESLDVRE